MVSDMDVERTIINGPAVLRPVRTADARGWLSEAFNVRTWAALGLSDAPFVQDNESFSPASGTLRGLHFQRASHAQGKLVRVVRGAAFTVAVDIRRASVTFGAHIAMTLAADDGAQLWIPPGFAHGLVTTAPDTLVQSKLTAHFASVAGVAWDDPDLAIAWPPPGPRHISERDRAWPRLKDLPAHT